MSPNPMAGIFIMEKTALLQHIIPELSSSVGIEQNGIHKFDVFEHLLRSLQCAADKNYPLDVRVAALLHDIGKPPTREFSKEKQDYTFYGHEVVGARIASKILKRMKFPIEISELIVKLVRWHMFFSDTEKVTLSAARRLVANIGKDNIWKIIDVRICDRIGTGRPKEDPYRLRKYKAMIEQVLRDPVSVGMLKIDGKRLMELLEEPGGPRIGQILNALLGEIIETPELNTVEHLEKRALELSKIEPTELKELALKGSSIAQEQEEEYVKEILDKHKVK
jgi:poly(A) polymerase/tRNA nucleotidyltransferase (CCA-adding enzyme)